MALSSRDIRRIGWFLLFGFAAGTGVRYYIDHRHRADTHTDTPDNKLIDWEQARAVALKLSQWEQAPLHNRAMRQQQYTELVKRSEPLIATYLNVHLPEPISRVYVFDRREWLETNFESFEQLFQPIEEMYHQQQHHHNALSVALRTVNKRVIGTQLGVLIGFLGKRVLGQYDLSLLSPDPAVRGALYYIEPNIAAVQTKLALDDEDFRLWIALHETTHAFEFEAYPWVRDHFKALLHEYFDQLNTYLTNGGGLLPIVRRAIQRTKQSNNNHWIELVLTPEQRHIFEQLQALMSLVEGYSNHIMNEIGNQLLPSFKDIEQRMAQRQQSKTLPERLFYRLTGMDLKMAQYQQGEAFVNAVVAERGIAFAARVWEKAAFLPTMAEICNPSQWIARIDASLAVDS